MSCEVPELFTADDEGPLSEFTYVSTIAKTRQAVLHLAVWKNRNCNVVLKVYNVKSLSERRIAAVWREAQIPVFLASCDVPNICSTHWAFQANGHVVLVQTYCEGGSLLGYLKKRNCTLTEAEACCRVAVPMLITVWHMVQYSVLHGDIKPENIFLSQGLPYLGDFGLANQLTKSIQTTAGTLDFMAPEIILLMAKHRAGSRLHGYGLPADIWALGITLYQLICGQRPWQSEQKADVMSDIFHLKLQALPTAVSHLAEDFIMCMLRQCPERRAKPAWLLKHPWIVRHLGDLSMLMRHAATRDALDTALKARVPEAPLRATLVQNIMSLPRSFWAEFEACPYDVQSAPKTIIPAASHSPTFDAARCRPSRADSPQAASARLQHFASPDTIAVPDYTAHQTSPSPRRMDASAAPHNPSWTQSVRHRLSRLQYAVPLGATDMIQLQQQQQQQLASPSLSRNSTGVGPSMAHSYASGALNAIPTIALPMSTARSTGLVNAMPTSTVNQILQRDEERIDAQARAGSFRGALKNGRFVHLPRPLPAQPITNPRSAAASAPQLAMNAGAPNLSPNVACALSCLSNATTARSVASVRAPQPSPQPQPIGQHVQLREAGSLSTELPQMMNVLLSASRQQESPFLASASAPAAALRRHSRHALLAGTASSTSAAAHNLLDGACLGSQDASRTAPTTNLDLLNQLILVDQAERTLSDPRAAERSSPYYAPASRHAIHSGMGMSVRRRGSMPKLTTVPEPSNGGEMSSHGTPSDYELSVPPLPQPSLPSHGGSAAWQARAKLAPGRGQGFQELHERLTALAASQSPPDALWQEAPMGPSAFGTAAPSRMASASNTQNDLRSFGSGSDATASSRQNSLRVCDLMHVIPELDAQHRVPQS